LQNPPTRRPVTCPSRPRCPQLASLWHPGSSSWPSPPFSSPLARGVAPPTPPRPTPCSPPPPSSIEPPFLDAHFQRLYCVCDAVQRPVTQFVPLQPRPKRAAMPDPLQSSA